MGHNIEASGQRVQTVLISDKERMLLASAISGL